MENKINFNTSTPTQEELFDMDSFEGVSNFLLKKSLFLKPNYITKSAWLEHIPFAFWLAETLQPKRFVELGTHYGSSYFAFCQAISQQDWDAQCFAVDTWQGDEHAGIYGREVHAQVYEHNQRNYADFSTLIKTSFDEALQHFADGSIDLLHIDGLHTLDAVRHDFDSWLPKLSVQGVIIMHDTNVRKNQFGVFKLFEELKEQYPHFEFSHGHGLGVIGVGVNQIDVMQKFFSLSTNRSATRYTRDIFSHLGRACSDNWENSSFKKEISNLKKSLNKESKLTSDEQSQLLHLKEQVSHYEKELQERYEEISIITKIAEQHQLELDNVRIQLNHEKNIVNNIQNTLSWKITKPIRTVRRMMNSIKS